VTLTVTDASGAVIRTMKKLPNQSGLNRTTWDLRFEPPEGGLERPRPDAPPATGAPSPSGGADTSPPSSSGGGAGAPS